MREYIKKIQSKPEPVRKQIVVGLLACSMIFVGIVFVYSVKSTLRGDEHARTTDSFAPFKILGNSISDTYDNVQASVGKISLPKKEDALTNTTISDTTTSQDASISETTNTVIDENQYE